MIDEITLEEFKILYKTHSKYCFFKDRGLLDLLVRNRFVKLKEPVLTKEILKEKGVAGKTLLKHKHNSNTFLYIGFNRADILVTDDARGKYSAHWLDGEIELLEIVEESND